MIPVVATSGKPVLPLGEWQRLHPLSPLIRGGVFFLAFIGFVVAQWWERLLGALGVPGYRDRDLPGDAGGEVTDALELGWLVIVLGATAVLLVIVGAAWLSWRFTRFRVADGQIELRRGWVFRQHRQVPLARVQSVEITRPVLARLTGLSAVVVRSAGSGTSHLPLEFLGQSRALEVRDRLLELAGMSDEVARLPAVGAEPAGELAGGPVAAAPGGATRVPAYGGRVILQVPNGRLFLATILHPGSILLGAMAVAVLAFYAAGEVGAWALGIFPGMIPVVIGVGAGRVRELLRHGNFVLADLGTSVRATHGLTELTTTMVPLHRIQAVEVYQSLWWRWPKWWRIRINVAGAKLVDGGGITETVVLPVGTIEDAQRICAVLDPRLPGEALLAALHGMGGDPHWVGVPSRARQLDPWGYRRAGYAVTADSVIFRRGWFSRSAVVVPHARIQSMTLAQGPMQRFRDLATVQLVSTLGPVRPRLEHLGTAEAEFFLAEQVARSSVARTAAPITPLSPLHDPGSL